MDIISTLTNVIKDLISKRTALHNKIAQDKKLLEQQKIEIAELERGIMVSEKSIGITKNELDNINKTIEQTEMGYKKILEAGETLMSVVSENVSEYKNLNYNPINTNF